MLSQTEVLLLVGGPGLEAGRSTCSKSSGTRLGRPGGRREFSYSDTSVEADTGYSYTVQGIGADGQRSDMSAAIDVTTPAPDVTPVDES